MTAINAFIKKDRGILMTDASMYTPQGLVVGFGQKALALPTLKAAVACRGAQRMAGLLAIELSIRFRDFDALLSAGPDGFARAVSAVLRNCEQTPALGISSMEEVQLVVVGWSDSRSAAVGFSYDTTAADPFDYFDDWVAAPAPTDEEDANLHSIGCELEEDIDAKSFHPIRHGIPLMEAQRRMKVMPAASDLDEPLHIVGGHILLTEVGADGVSQRVIHRWNDVVGESIEPEPFRLPAPASRADRRRLERA